MGATNDKGSSREWDNKDIIVNVHIECLGEFNDEVAKSIIMEELNESMYSSGDHSYRVTVKNITFADRLN
tara:strand:+ start:2679 stop:2888 length:210 start_codon:yes stop_codon:yes gene_type:complete